MPEEGPPQATPAAGDAPIRPAAMIARQPPQRSALLGVIPTCFSAVIGEACVSLVAVANEPQRRPIETVALEPYGSFLGLAYAGGGSARHR
jgi:hypothetical protein